MIKKIGVENFRVFKDYTEFEIRPITLLTGPNNSGKSSFTKLLLLLENGIEELHFRKGNHNLESFEKVLNWDTNNSQLRIRLIGNSAFFQCLNVDYIYEDGKLKELHVLNEDKNLLTYSYKFDGPHEDWDMYYPIDQYLYQYFTIDIENLIDMLFEMDVPVHKNSDQQYQNVTSDKFQEARDNIKPDEINRTNYRENFLGSLDKQSRAYLAIKNEIKDLEKSHLLFNLFIDGIDQTDDYRDKILEFQKEIYDTIEIQEDPENPEGMLSDVLESFRFHLKFINENAEDDFDYKFKEKFNIPESSEIDFRPTIIYEILFVEKWFNYEPASKNSGETFFEQFKNLIASDKALRSIEYISANRGSQKRVLQNSSENEIDKIVVDFLEAEEQHIDFLAEVFQILGIKGKLTIERYQNTISVVYLEQEDRKISLADLGYGFSQVIPIFLKMILSFKRYDAKTLIIEEPEANLHPALQSKFADILVLATKKFPGMTFILETHSEYLIRKLQYLTAKKELAPDTSVIYYFNADEVVTHSEPKVIKIEITETGNLTNNFGPGFFDEITRLQFELMKIKKEQNN